jgi:hypothetical protein
LIYNRKLVRNKDLRQETLTDLSQEIFTENLFKKADEKIWLSAIIRRKKSGEKKVR